MSAVTTPLGIELTGLYDCARLARELHVSRAAAEAIMRRVPKQQIPGLRKSYVRGADVQKLLDDNVVDVKTDAPLSVITSLGRVA